jgi:hypothetical protein
MYAEIGNTLNVAEIERVVSAAGCTCGSLCV